MVLTRRITPSPSYTSISQSSDRSGFELTTLDSTTSSPPPYDKVVSPNSFYPTAHLQIESQGKSWLSLPLPPRPVPIPIFTLDNPEDSALTNPSYASFRPERCSGSCYLSFSNQAASGQDSVPVASTTTYRFGPNRPPLIRIFSSGAILQEPILRSILYPKDTPEAGADSLPAVWDCFTIESLGLFTRSIQFISSRIGKLQWRYASRAERKAAAGGASSLLVLERVKKVDWQTFGCDGMGMEKKEVRTVVAHFVRNDTFRTKGSSGSSAGNGGRLMVDLRELSNLGGEEQDGNEKTAEESKQMALVVVLTTCLVMLKREVDRRRAQQIAIMAGAAAGS